MITYFFYLAEASICLALFYILYLLLIKADTFHQLKRFYLLGSIVLAFLIPKLPSTGWTSSIEKTVVPQKSQNVQNPIAHNTFEMVVTSAIPYQAEVKNDQRKSVSLFSVMFLIYFLGAGFMFFRLTSNLLQISNLIKKHDHEPFRKYTIIKLKDNYPTFSFFRNIFLNDSGLSIDDKNDILFHEETHIKQGHSFDIIFIEVCKILLWFNPVLWFYKNSLVKVHECLVDECVIDLKSVNVINYQSLLLNQYLSNIKIELAQPFNYSFIKFRINMMTKTKSKWWAKYKLVFAVPIILLSIVVFSNCQKKVAWTLSGSHPDDYKTGIDNQISYHGHKSAFIESAVNNPRPFCTLMQWFNLKDLKGKRIKMTGFIKSQGLRDTSLMWIRVDNFDTKVTSDFDNMWERPIVGTKDWTKCEIVFDIPNSKCTVNYGFVLHGEGKIWVDDLSFEIVSNSVWLTTFNLNQPLPPNYLERVTKKYPKDTDIPDRPPVNLDFED